MIAILLCVRRLLLVMTGLTVFHKSLRSIIPFFVILLKCFLIAFFSQTNTYIPLFFIFTPIFIRFVFICFCKPERV